ncbi:unnamed protein product [Cyprideis torosa]|uniref:Uncharacterized protein n=1 Tax=Cyprideis torosa TaxID=163714 RepID=A0A7R8WB45_9CRUS|nr:unnamed protein product [Cyprideis torosa]CAG0891818.1 unnamed protein product [Cyprideis torosa]
MLLGVLLIGLTALVLTYYIREWWTKWRRLPPGPFGLPFFGYIHKLSPKRPFDTFNELGQTYGPLCTITVMGFTEVIINDYDMLREIFGMKESTGKPDTDFQRFHTDDSFENVGLLTSWGKVWSDNRRFSLKTLRNLGFGKTSTQDMVMESVHYVEEVFAKNLGVPFDVVPPINLGVFSTIRRFVAGESAIEKYDPFLDNFLKAFNATAKLQTQSSPINFFHPGFSRFYPELKLARSRLQKLLREFCGFVQDHKTTRDRNFHRDYTDAYLHEIEDNPLVDKDTMTERILHFNIRHLFVAGFDTITTTLRWALFFLVSHPEIQAKLQEELDQFQGERDRVDYEDANQLPYLGAFILETLRLGTSVPISAHIALKDVDYKGYHIPRGTWLVSNLYGLHLNPKYFPNPDVFDPSRHLSADGQVIQNQKGFVPFSIGQRKCLGETLAKMELFLYLGNLLRRFTFKAPPEVSLQSHLEAGIAGVTFPPPAHLLVIEERKGRTSKTGG